MDRRVAVRAAAIGVAVWLGCVLMGGAALAATVKIGFWGYLGGDEPSIQRMQRLIRAFEQANPDIKVEHTPLQLHEIKAKIVPAYLGDAAPDVWFLDRSDVAPMAAQGLLLPLDNFLQGDREVNSSTFFPGTLDSVRFNGKVYAIPNMLELWVLYRNLDMMAAAGLDPAAPPRTLDQLADQAKKLTTHRDGKVDRAGYVHLWTNFGPYGLLRQYGGAYFSQDGRKALLASDAARNAVTAYRSFADRVYGGYAAMDGVWGNWGQGGPFINAQVAFWADWHWAEARWDELKRQGGDALRNLNYGVSPLAAPAGRTPLNVAGGWAYVVSNKSRFPEAAWRFIRFSLSRDGQAILSGDATGKEYLVISGNRHYEVQRLSQKLDRFPRFNVALEEANQHLTYREPHPLFAEADKAFGEAAQAVLRGEMSPDAALARAAQTVQARLDEYWRARR